MSAVLLLEMPLGESLHFNAAVYRFSAIQVARKRPFMDIVRRCVHKVA